MRNLRENLTLGKMLEFTYFEFFSFSSNAKFKLAFWNINVDVRAFMNLDFSSTAFCPSMELEGV
jgi:hypothetical protein